MNDALVEIANDTTLSVEEREQKTKEVIEFYDGYPATVNDAEWAAYENKTEGVRKAYGAYLIGEVNNMCDAADALTGADLLAAYNRLNAYYRSHDFYVDQSYFDFLDRLQTLSERAAEALVEVKAKLEAEVPLAEYADTSKLELQRIVREGLNRLYAEMC